MCTSEGGPHIIAAGNPGDTILSHNFHAMLLVLRGGRIRGVAHDYALDIPTVRFTHRGFHRSRRRISGDDEFLQSKPSNEYLKVSSIKGAKASFDHHKVSRSRCKFRNDHGAKLALLQ